MKAKVITTGEIVNVRYSYFDNDKHIAVYKEIGNIRSWPVYDLQLDIKEEKPIDWEQRRFELVKAAMQGMLSNDQYVSSAYKKSSKCDATVEDVIAFNAIKYADKVIARLKEE